MEAVARIELGMTSEDFYNCTWYDWSLWVERISELRHRRKQDQELLIEMFRSTLCYYYNWNRGKDNPERYPWDFWRLSYDTEKPVEERELTEEEKAKLAETIKRLESKSRRRKRG